MSDAIKHECGISLIRLLKPLEYYKEKYGTAFYGVNKMYLMMEKQHNRGQDGAGFASIKLDMPAGSRYMSRVRSAEQQPIQDIFAQINQRISSELQANPEYQDSVALQKQHVPYIGELLLGHVRYGTFGKNSIESVHPFLRQNNWMHRNLIVAGNFNMTNVNELFDNFDNCYDNHSDYIIHLDKDLSYMPNGVQVIQDGLEFRKLEFWYSTPQNFQKVLSLAKSFKELYAKKNSKEYYRVYRSGFGAPGQFILVAISAKSAEDYERIRKENKELLGVDRTPIYDELLKSIIKVETLNGYMRKDLSYIPKDKK